MTDILLRPTELRQVAEQLRHKARNVQRAIAAIDAAIRAIGVERFDGNRAGVLRAGYSQKRDALLQASSLVTSFAGGLDEITARFEAADREHSSALPSQEGLGEGIADAARIILERPPLDIKKLFEDILNGTLPPPITPQDPMFPKSPDDPLFPPPGDPGFDPPIHPDDPLFPPSGNPGFDPLIHPDDPRDPGHLSPEFPWLPGDRPEAVPMPYRPSPFDQGGGSLPTMPYIITPRPFDTQPDNPLPTLPDIQVPENWHTIPPEVEFEAGGAGGSIPQWMTELIRNGWSYTDGVWAKSGE